MPVFSCDVQHVRVYHAQDVNYEIHDVDVQCPISVFPVPAENFLHVTVPDNPELNALLFTTDGKEIIQKKLLTPETYIDLSTFVPGLYILKITDDTGESVQTFEIVKL